MYATVDHPFIFELNTNTLFVKFAFEVLAKRFHLQIFHDQDEKMKTKCVCMR